MQQIGKELIQALTWESAHVSFSTATRDLQLPVIGKTVHGLPYTIWQLAEHICFAQKDILDFCTGSDYIEPTWPDDYWPKQKAPDTIEEWEKCLGSIKNDRQRMVDLVADENFDLFEPFPHGSGQNLFREAMLIIDHEAYHTGQIVVIRKMVGEWG